ncbi:MAG: hypothetical protein C9356_11245 [Oleiphilus sp.]|nr:MAG: hypothetical protein C9356_11245 [Oleiphilus sp.]
MKLQTEFIPLKDGSQICAPSNITLMTAYVLWEQGDWFEDEIRFARVFTKPSMAALDIGANYGLYSNAIAKKLGPKGRLWCFEPTPNTAEALRATIKRNKYKGRVKVLEYGLSDQAGSATFYMSPNAELNSLEPTEGAFTRKQTIELTTLDDFMSQHSLPTIDFIKLDAEGEELNILRGGKAFFERHAPLVMFELMHVDKVNQALLNEFKAMNFALYYLIPGLNTLAPFEQDKGFDRFLLNLFAVPLDRIPGYEQEGVLVGRAESVNEPPGNEYVERCKALVAGPSGLPDPESKHGRIMLHLAAAMNKEQPMQARYQSLSEGYQLLGEAGVEDASPEMLATAARLSFHIGQREAGLGMLERFLRQFVAQGKLPEVTESYMAPHRALDGRPLAEDPGVNLCASMVESFIRMGHRSGYFAGSSLIPHFKVLKQLGALSPDMARREKVALARAAAMQTGGSK